MEEEGGRWGGWEEEGRWVVIRRRRFRTRIWHESCGVCPPQSCTLLHASICLEAPGDVILLPCGHAGICEPCARRIIACRKRGRSALCPVCRSAVGKLMKLTFVDPEGRGGVPSDDPTGRGGPPTGREELLLGTGRPSTGGEQGEGDEDILLGRRGGGARDEEAVTALRAVTALGEEVRIPKAKRLPLGMILKPKNEGKISFQFLRRSV